MTTTNLLCDAPVQGLSLRIAILDSCGAVVSGAGGGVLVTDSFVQVQAAPQYDTGDRKIRRTAAGVICVNRKIPDQYTNDELTIDFCAWNPGVLVATIAARLLTATASPTGSGIAHGTWANATQSHWSLEVWGVPDQDCTAAGLQYYPYYAWPHLSDGKRGQVMVGEDPTNLQIIANTYDSSPLWTLGDTYLGAGQVVQGDHFLRNLQNTAPPPAACAISTYP